jgi:hypothetical protein
VLDALAVVHLVEALRLDEQVFAFQQPGDAALPRLGALLAAGRIDDVLYF